MSYKAPLFKTIIFAVVAMFLITLMWNTLSNSVGDSNRYTAVFADASGLNEGDDVRIAGVRVGRVEGVELVDTHAEVTFSVEETQPVFEDSRVLIRYQNLIGMRYLALTEGKGETRLADGAKIPMSRTEGSLDISVLLNGFQPLFRMLEPGDVNQLADSIIKVLQGEGPALQHLLTQAAEFTGRLADRDELIGAVITNLTAVVENIATKDAQFEDLITQLHQLVTGLAARRSTISDALASVDLLTDSTAGLIQEIRPDLRADVAKFSEVAGIYAEERDTVEAVLQDMPVFYGALAKVFGYGSWGNGYACHLTLNVPPLPVGLVGGIAGHRHSAVCR